MRLISLDLKNFKSHKDFHVHFGDVTKITGANGTGKTSVFDAFCWVLTGKDSLGRVCGTGQKGEATIRPRGADGELVRQVEISVTAELMDEDGEVTTLLRVFTEVWSADKNTGEKLFKGNTTKYFINDVPTPANKYDAWVKDHVDPELLRLTGDPGFFPTMQWQDQRRWLLKLAGTVTDADVIAAHEELKPLEVGRYSITDIKAMAQNKLKLANKAIKEDVIRIDQTVVLAGNSTEADLEAQIAKYDEMVAAQAEMVAEAESELLKAKSAGRKMVAMAEYDAARLEVENWEQRRHNKIEAVKADIRRQADMLAAEIERVKTTKAKQRASVEELLSKNRELEEEKQKLYKQYDAENDREFTEDVCPFCHQKIQNGIADELHGKFNADKARKLEEIVTRGKQVAASINRNKEQIEALMAGVDADAKVIDDTQKLLDGMHDEERKALEAVPQLEDVAAFREARAKRDRLKRELDGLEEPDTTKLQEVLDGSRSQLAMLQDKRSELKAQKGTLMAVADLRENLQVQRVLADEASTTLRMVSEFIQAKCRMLTDAVNKLFPGLEWRLFSQNITNDDVVETCELTMHGVNYRDLSQGEKIRAGMLIVDKMQEKLGVKTPVWIDGAESITFTPDVKSQLVLLKAQENINELKIEEA